MAAGPEPDGADASAIQGAETATLQAHKAGAVSITDALPPAAENVRLVSLREALQPPPDRLTFATYTSDSPL